MWVVGHFLIEKDSVQFRIRCWWSLYACILPPVVVAAMHSRGYGDKKIHLEKNVSQKEAKLEHLIIIIRRKEIE